MTFLEKLAKRRATGDALCIHDKAKDKDWVEIYDEVMGTCCIHGLIGVGVTVWEPLDTGDLNNVKEHLKSLYDINLLSFEELATCIQRGCIALTLSGELPSDVNEWDMDHIAELGASSLVETG